MTPRAKAQVDLLYPRYDSQAEAIWARIGELILANEVGKQIVLTQYHPVTFHLPGGTYTPDFLAILDDGTLIFIEIKGSKRQQNYRDARSKLRAAADLYRWATFYEVIVTRGNVQSIELIKP